MARGTAAVSSGAARGAAARGAEVRHLEEFPTTPWRNGAGVSREVAFGSAELTPSPSADPVWRVSVAELTGDADFSVYAGYDRQFVVASDYRIGLRVVRTGTGTGTGTGTRTGTGARTGTDPHTHHELGRGQSLRFAGEALVSARLNCRRARALNLFVKRSSVRGRVEVVRRNGTLTFAHPPRLIMLLSGDARLADGRRIPHHGILEPGRRSVVLTCGRATLAAVYISNISEQVDTREPR